MVFIRHGYKSVTFALAGFPFDNEFKVNVFNLVNQSLLLISSFFRSNAFGVASPLPFK